MTDLDELGIQRQKILEEAKLPESSSSSRGVECGLELCLDYSILSFRKPLPVIKFLKEYLPGFRGINDVKRLRNEINTALQGLRVMTSIRRQKLTIAELTREDVIDIYFDLVDREGKSPPRRTSLVKFYKEKWNKEILYPDIPCLELGTPQRSNKVPMEFCVLVEKQRYIPKEGLDKNSALFLRKLAVAKPRYCRTSNTMCDMAEDGPLGHLTLTTFPRFNYSFISLQIHKCSGVEITKVVGQAIDPPPPPDKLQSASKSIDSWAVVDFTFTHGEYGYNRQLPTAAVINSLSSCCQNLGIKMGEPLVYRFSRMHESSFVEGVEDFLKSIVEESVTRNKGKRLDIIVCLMTSKKSLENKYIKWVSDTRIGVMMQCLSAPLVLNKGINHYLVCVCHKIKAKLWGRSDLDLTARQWHFDDADDDVMFIGAYVKHPAPENKSRPSIAAVVATVNWPAANRYAARIRPQANRSETINNFGAMCKELIMAYARLNDLVRPRRIVVFRNGTVSDGKLESVVSAELIDLKKSIYEGGNYQPPITVIATQRQHPTLHLVDAASTTTTLNPEEYGAGSPTHYNVLWDENSFASDELLKLVHDMGFRPLWLLPPLYYARRASRRGRLYQELAAEIDSCAAVSSFDPSFYSVHPDMDGTMFFI
ncbi:hypothetical protein C2S51_006931 [Perilla frutescens var. frutescens]|nr:hypothetical protein C2S51_006931 [Perilla frutescens var. frutescens]